MSAMHHKLHVTLNLFQGLINYVYSYSEPY